MENNNKSQKSTIQRGKEQLKNPRIWTTCGIALTLITASTLTTYFATSSYDKHKNAEIGTISPDTWYDVDLPDGWELNGSQEVVADDSKLTHDQVKTTYQSLDKQCYYGPSVTYRPHSKLSDILTPASASASALIPGYDNENNKNLASAFVILSTTSGKVKAPMATFTAKYDLDADGKKDDVSEAHVLYIDPHATKVNKEKNLQEPVLDISMLCIGDDGTASGKIQDMLDHTTFYTKNEELIDKDRGFNN